MLVSNTLTQARLGRASGDRFHKWSASIRLGGAERKLEPAMAGTCQLHTENHTQVLATVTVAQLLHTVT